MFLPCFLIISMRLKRALSLYPPNLLPHSPASLNTFPLIARPRLRSPIVRSHALCCQNPVLTLRKCSLYTGKTFLKPIPSMFSLALSLRLTLKSAARKLYVVYPRNQRPPSVVPLFLSVLTVLFSHLIPCILNVRSSLCSAIAGLLLSLCKPRYCSDTMYFWTLVM